MSKISPKNNQTSALSSQVFDTLVIGGGITGATTLWDSSLRGLKAVLIEKNDFASGTTQATSKLIHGGLRYLKNAEFGLVRESLRERRILAKISPNALKTLGFVIPVYSSVEKWITHVGLGMYDQFSYDRNREISSDSWIPKYRFLSKEETILEAPSLPREGLKGGFLYYDYQNINPERHTCEFIFSAEKKGGLALNYTELIAISRQGEVYQAIVKDKRSGKSYPLFAKTIVNAAGPWADFVESLAGVGMDKVLVRSKGIHIVTRSLTVSKTIVLKKRDKTHMFVIPWRGKTIIGTTDTVFSDSPDHFKVTKSDIQGLLEEINYAYGYSDLTEADVDFYYGGMRPLVEDPGEKSDTYNASRKTEILDHKEKGLPGFFTALGGKYTTSRHLAEKITDKLCEFLPGSYHSCETTQVPLLTGEFSDHSSLVQSLAKKYPKLEGKYLETLASRYGSLAYEVLKLHKQGESSATLCNGETFSFSEIRYIASKEKIEKATDFFFRRSGVGVPGIPSAENLQAIMDELGKTLGWNPGRKKVETAEVVARYKF
ncbi:glycerol-3-phosphate dehydrogenase/oxidase [Leptospira langatensis]|uniref:Glycerol-3-phosphate dehydrogenase/oxidase n=1 Tax=Leptospira langatensis TaxID=2484983 RepID=A0A5F1ZR45_9LEPT|nr:glycerol-3-phosphate dehydrogenase/oxidase [Leptospira langatensis]TGK05612.1 glycerol-3-phosphate dehydrogenase/oxidase [Leptospira langatensis]TGL38743.1 glycerol-3-phosphate dehydrogenase/oxidase [Leptospira langatensis]